MQTRPRRRINKLYKNQQVIINKKDLIVAIDNNQKVEKDVLEIAKGLPYRDFITVGLLIQHNGICIMTTQ